MNNASNLLNDLARAWEDAEDAPASPGDRIIERHVCNSDEDTYYTIGTHREGMRGLIGKSGTRILERAPKPEPKPRVVMASYVHDAGYREAYTLQPHGEWESLQYAVEADDLVDPVEMVEMPSREELLEALGRAYDAWAQEVRMTRGADDHRADAVLELLRGEH